MKQAVVFDTEFTTWEGAMARKWSGPGEYRELVQIGAVRINASSFEVVETLDILVRPVRNPVLSGYFINLTGITQAMLEDKAVPFATALERFQDFVGQSVPWAYGGDVDVIAENMRLNDMAVPADWWTREQTNIGPWFHQHAPQTIGVNSGRLAKVLGAGEVSAEHTGLGDSLSIVAAAKKLVSELGLASPF